jgi:ATP synthase subunit C
VSRNPSLSKQLFGYAILGFALSEAMALFALMVAFFILFSDGVHPLPSILLVGGDWSWWDGGVGVEPFLSSQSLGSSTSFSPVISSALVAWSAMVHMHLTG